MKKTLTAFMLMFLFCLKSQEISPFLFGQNAWMPDTIGNTFYNGKLHQNWSKIKDSKASIIRFGGIGVDQNKATNSQYLKIIDSIKINNMEPIIQVPFNNGQYNSQQAASIVHFLNIESNKNVKYFIIGNEPNLGYNMNSSQITFYIKSFSSAMKSVDPNILIIGPELAWFDKTIIDNLTTPNGPDDISGKDMSGKYYIDVFSFHDYPMGNQNSNPYTRSDLINKLTSIGNFQDNLYYLNNRISVCNSTHGRTGNFSLKIAVTELNIVYQNSSDDNLNGLGSNSFVGAQFITEMFCLGAKSGVNIMNMWSVVEGNNNQSNCGYIDPFNGNKKPSYYHFQLLSENFRGKYLISNDNQNNIKCFSCQSNNNISVLILNQDLTNNFNYTIKLNNTNIQGNFNLKVNVDANINNEYSDIIKNQTTLLLTFNPQGTLIKKIEYSINNQIPIISEFSLNGLTSIDKQDELHNIDNFNIILYPNPAKSKFMIELDRNNEMNINFKIELYDLLGRNILSIISQFVNKKQILDFNGMNLAEAVYIVKISEEKNEEKFKTKKVILFK